MQGIDDLLVRVRREGGPSEPARYQVEMWLEGGRRFNALEELQLADYVEPQIGDPQALAAHGLDLFNRLFSGRLAAAFQQAWTAASARGNQLRLRLDLDPLAPALHAVPWELLHFDNSGGTAPPHPLAADAGIAFSRYIESAEFDEGQPVSHRPLRMLLAIADPDDLQERWGLAPVGRAAEARDFKTRFSPIVSSGQFRYDLLPTASREALHSALGRGGLEADQPAGYDVLLYMGHALYHAERGSRLVLEHPETGRVQLYDSDELVTFVQKLPASHRPAMVVLVACNSAFSLGSGTMGSLAARLVSDAGVPAVLAMQRLVEVALARSFTYHLSEQLLRDGVIDVAVNAARRRVFRPDEVGWSTPTLYMRNAQGRLFTPNAQLEYVGSVLANPAYVRWAGPSFIDIGVLAVSPGQSLNLLRSRPEDAPATVSVLEALGRRLMPAQSRDRHRTSWGDAAGNLTALVGPPHSGQTTILQRLAYDLAVRVTGDPTQPPGLMISLSGYESQRGAGRLERHIIEQARATTPALGEALSDLFRPQRPGPPGQASPRYIFLLDNLDSVPAQARVDAIGELAALAERLGEQQFVITSALDSFPAQMLRGALVLLIQPLSEQQIFGYIRQREERGAIQIFSQIRDNRLMALASDPSLLALMYERLAADPLARLTRNQLVQEHLDRALSGLSPRYSIGAAARESLGELAWHSRWEHQDQIALADAFRIMAAVRRDRDYSLEDLYHMLAESRLLMGVGQFATRFVNPALHAYCAAVALAARPDFAQRLRDIITQCSSPQRQIWWEDVLYALTGLVADPLPLFENLAAAIRAGSYTHVLIAARCLEALPVEQDARLPAALRDELLDACVLRLRSDREPMPERREQIAVALGRLSYPQVRHELRRILVERVRQTDSGPRYEYTNVRIAAARALRNIYLPNSQITRPSEPPPTADALLLVRQSDDTTSLLGGPEGAPAAMPPVSEIRNDQMLIGLMRVWKQGASARDDFRDILRNSPFPPERALAAFALGDLSDTQGQKLRDARQLLRVILSPTDRGDAQISDDWADTVWAAADALTLFEPSQVIPLLTVLIRRKRAIPNSAAQQLAYLAGRLRANNAYVVAWLIGLLVTNPSQMIKSKALQSLAWMGQELPDQRLDLGDGRPGPTLRQLIQDIAAWRSIRRLRQGTFRITQRRTDVEGSPIYLRRKAIEALAWVGDAATLTDLAPLAHSWPLELREYWYSAAATIRERTGSGGGNGRP